MLIYNIENFDDPRLYDYTRLTEAQLRNRLEPEKGIFIAESYKVIKRALDAGMVVQSFLMDEKKLEPSAKLLEKVNADIPVYVLPPDQIRKLTGFDLTKGVLAAFKRPKLASPKELLLQAKQVAVLDGLVDHTNVGAIFRSAAALGVDAVLVSPSCCDPLYRRAVRVSMGTVFQVPWTRIGEDVSDWKKNGVGMLKRLGFTTLAFALADDARALDSSVLGSDERSALIFGSEGHGLDDQITEACDYVVKIPMAHGVDSLNVSAASAVAFWQLCHVPSKKSM